MYNGEIIMNRRQVKKRMKQTNPVLFTFNTFVIKCNSLLKLRGCVAEVFMDTKSFMKLGLHNKCKEITPSQISTIILDFRRFKYKLLNGESVDIIVSKMIPENNVRICAVDISNGCLYTGYPGLLPVTSETN